MKFGPVEKPVRISTLGSWDYIKTGQYTVKSGYWVQKNILNRKTSIEEDQPSLHSLYQLAWSTDTSPKIHLFMEMH